MAENILITGGAGFIGANLALNLVGRGYNVSVLDNLLGQVHGDDPGRTSLTYRLIDGKVDLIRGTIVSRNDVEKAVKNVDIIVHLAAETGTGQSMYKAEHYTQINVDGTRLLLDVLAHSKHRVKKVIVASSRAIYGEGKYSCGDNSFVYPGPRNGEDMSRGDFEVQYAGCSDTLKAVATDEESEIHPSSVYGITKQKQEQLIMSVCPAIDIVPVALRFQNVYGPGQSLNNPYTGILAIFSTLVRSGKAINVFEDGRSTRDFIYIDDAVNATIAAIEMDEANSGVFNVGTGVATEVLSVVNLLTEYIGREVPVNISGNYRLGDIRHNFADTTKIKQFLGFTPKTSFKDGIKLFADWAKQQDLIDSGYERSLREMREKGLFK